MKPMSSIHVITNIHNQTHAGDMNASLFITKSFFSN